MLRLVLRCKQRNCCQNTLFLQVLARAWYRWRLSHLGHNHVRVLQQKNSQSIHCSRVCNARCTNICAGLVPMMLSGIFLYFNPATSFKDDHVVSTQPEADYLWRIVIMLGMLALFMLWARIVVIVLSI